MNVNEYTVKIFFFPYHIFCLFGHLRPTFENFSTLIDMSQLRVKGLEFWPMLDICSYWAVKVLYPATLTVTWGIHLSLSSPRNRDTYTCCRAFGSGAVNTWFYDLGVSRLGFGHPTFRMRGECSNRLRHHGEFW